MFMAACQAATVAPDPEPEGDESYDGPSSSGVIPTYEPENLDAGDLLIDAGFVEVDTRCCTTHFRIIDQEPVETTGTLNGDSRAFGDGLPLVRNDAGWEATACFPLESSATYWYTFTTDAGFVDGGVEIDREDGGENTVLVHLTETVIRASGSEPGFDTAVGRRNFYRAVSSCDGLDGSVP